VKAGASPRLLFAALAPSDGPGRVLVALSGGPDSCALLLALLEASDGADPGSGPAAVPRPVAAAHFHHGLRGEDADRDAAFAAGLCARFGVPCLVELGSVPHGSGEGSPNAAARRERYRFLIRAARRVGADLIATAHTADDQAETVLLRVLRGAGVDGLAGIPERRRLASGVDVVRPLLDVPRTDIETYLSDRGVIPRRDPSNLLPRYPRARLRARLPEIASEFNPRLRDALTRLAASAAADSDFLSAHADKLWLDAARTHAAGDLRLSADVLRPAHPALRRRVLLRAVRTIAEGLGSDEAAVTASWVAALDAFLTAGHGVADLPGAVRAAIDSASGDLLLSVPVRGLESDLPPATLPLPVPGRVAVPWAIRHIVAVTARFVGDDEPRAPRVRRAREVDLALADVAPPPLAVRPAREGERMAPFGMGGHTRLLRDLLADAGVPAADRDRAVVVTRADTDAVLWLVGIAQSEETRVENGHAVRVRLGIEPQSVLESAPH
jgi:tRNA(Ile)-lysidine synthetase-like protein